jgi:hypothetical protein
MERLRGTDVKGKVVVLFTNEPPSDDPKFFGGKALTYYGRWTYKYEEVLPAGRGRLRHPPHHPHGRIRVGGSPQLLGQGRPAGEARPRHSDALAFAGWVTRAAAEKPSRKNLDDLLKRADQRGFTPVPLKLSVSGKPSPPKSAPIQTANVAAIVPGSDPELSKEAVVFSAHWDHLGIGTRSRVRCDL